MLELSKSFEVVRASAGSGKTYRLVLRYLECALGTDEKKAFSRILALTFTNKAAAEMKERILEDLKLLTGGRGDKFLELKNNLTLTDEVLIARATSLHKEMLHRYSDISVMTIDSFVNRLVRSFTRDLALEQDFRVELNSEKVIDDAVSRLLERVGVKGNEAITNFLEGFANLQIEEDKDYRLRKPLNELGIAAVKEKMRGVVDSFKDLSPEKFKEVSNKLKKTTSISENLLKETSLKALDKIDQLAMEDSDFSGGRVPKSLRKFSSGRIKELKVTIREHLTNPESMIRKNSPNHLVLKAQELGDYLLPVFEAAMEMLPETDNGKMYLLAKKILKRLDLMGTLSELHKEILKVQIENNIRTFDSMHHMISQIVRHNPAPFIYERLGNRYSHIFMDEFQDTSITQWHNLVVLYDHALSSNHKTLVVGDGKQAIYRWRNGDYKQLMDLPQLQGNDLGIALEDAQRSLSNHYFKDNLDKNYRSGFEIVNWNNKLFQALTNHLPDELKQVYSKQQQLPVKKFPGAVNLELVIEKTVKERRNKHVEVIVSRLRDYVSQGFNPGDITILVRTNREGAVIAQELLKTEFKPMTEESLHLGRHPGPLAVVALVRWILRPKDNSLGTTILQCVAALSNHENNRNCKLVDEAYFLEKYTVIKQVESSKWSSRTTSIGYFETQEMLGELFPHLKAIEKSSEPLVAFLGHICEQMGITSNFPAYAEGILELSREASSSAESGLHGFLRLWDAKGKERSVITTPTSDSVNIMTVHKAKGLAFKVTMVLLTVKDFTRFRGVIPVTLNEDTKMPLNAAMLENYDMKDTVVEDQRVSEINQVILDSVNVVYVAFTRPVERLDVIIELETEDFDRNKVKSVGELIVKSLEGVMGGVLVGGKLTESDLGKPLVSCEKVENINPIKLRHLSTGETVNHLVSIPPSEGEEVIPDGLDALELGVQVHKMFEKIINLDDWKRIRKTLDSSLRFSEKDRHKIMERVQGVMNLDSAMMFFKQGIHVEVEVDLVDKSGEVLRPDRLVRIDNVWHVIDYKSSKLGKVSHEKQVRKYVNLLSKIETYEVKGWIIYTDPTELIFVV
jgi:ATP-dependent exoDNAse (exonuclease V) beta subunit